MRRRSRREWLGWRCGKWRQHGRRGQRKRRRSVRGWPAARWKHEVHDHAFCLASVTSDSPCVSACICDKCATLFVACSSEENCRFILECALATGCRDTATCASACPGIIDHVDGTTAALAVQKCYDAAKCDAMCPYRSGNRWSRRDGPCRRCGGRWFVVDRRGRQRFGARCRTIVPILAHQLLDQDRRR